MIGDRFDGGYFDRFYRHRRTRVAAPLDYVRRARLLAAYAELYQLKVRRVLDAGAGTGWFLRALDAAVPGMRGIGIDVSAYACETYGWRQASVTDYAADRPFDLVVCHDVLQYLPRDRAAQALQNLAGLCRGLMYFSVLTREDWQENCDRSRTDGEVYLRNAAWYRRQLRPAFRQVAAGIYLARSAPAVLFALDDASGVSAAR